MLAYDVYLRGSRGHPSFTTDSHDFSEKTELKKDYKRRNAYDGDGDGDVTRN